VGNTLIFKSSELSAKFLTAKLQALGEDSSILQALVFSSDKEAVGFDDL
jgi:hypothetical protein